MGAKDLDAILARIGAITGRIYDKMPAGRSVIREFFDELSQIGQVTPLVDAEQYAAQMRRSWRKR